MKFHKILFTLLCCALSLTAMNNMDKDENNKDTEDAEMVNLQTVYIDEYGNMHQIDKNGSHTTIFKRSGLKWIEEAQGPKILIAPDTQEESICFNYPKNKWTTIKNDDEDQDLVIITTTDNNKKNEG